MLLVKIWHVWVTRFQFEIWRAAENHQRLTILPRKEIDRTRNGAYYEAAVVGSAFTYPSIRMLIMRERYRTLPVTHSSVPGDAACQIGTTCVRQIQVRGKGKAAPVRP